jgi:hypothetical protein
MLWFCTRLRELQEALSAATITLEISGRNPRVAAPQRAGDECAPARADPRDQRGADKAHVAAGASGLLCRDYKVGKPRTLWSGIAPAWSPRVTDDPSGFTAIAPLAQFEPDPERRLEPFVVGIA